MKKEDALKRKARAEELASQINRLVDEHDENGQLRSYRCKIVKRPAGRYAGRLFMGTAIGLSIIAILAGLASVLPATIVALVLMSALLMAIFSVYCLAYGVFFGIRALCSSGAKEIGYTESEIKFLEQRLENVKKYCNIDK